MSTINAVIREEHQRLVNLQKMYQKEISKLPRGSVSIKTRNNRKYAYRSYRLNNHVKTDYIGPIDSDRVKELRVSIEKRKELESLLKTTAERLTAIRKVIK